MAEFKQDKRPLKISTPLGADKVLITGFSGSEQLSHPFRYEMELISTEANLAPNDILGQKVNVTLELADGGERFFNGHVSRFGFTGVRGGFSHYRATVVPWLWFLTREADCRIFQEKNIPDIIQVLFEEHGYSGNVEKKLSGTYEPWAYCVQYRETDFNFVSRLMEQEGIYYYFKHSDGNHKLVLADSPSAHDDIPGGKVKYHQDVSRLVKEEGISGWSVHNEVIPGKYALRDFNFETPETDLLSKANSTISGGGNSQKEIFDYPGEYEKVGEGNTYAKVRTAEIDAQYEVAQAQGNTRVAATGCKFELENEVRDNGKKFLITSATYQIASNIPSEGGGSSEFSYSCGFIAIEATCQFRPPRITPKPIVQGPQTAIVVGKRGQEIWTDKYGRVKVQFHWDRLGKKDENSSCWVRVAQPWAGKLWGMQALPRMGDEVIVEFLEGDPDHPIITGSVYNEVNKPRYVLPDNQTQWGIKSHSTPEAEGDAKLFNEIRFEDKKGEEKVYIHAEKDFERVVENNDTLKVGVNGDKTPNKGDQTIEVFNNQVLTVGKGEGDAADGSQTITIWRSRTVTLTKGDDKLEVKEGKHDIVIAVGNQTIDVKQGAQTLNIQKDQTFNIKQGNQVVKISAGKGSTEAAQSIELKVGGSSIKIEPAKITLKSVEIVIEGSAKVGVKGTMTDVKGDGILTLKGGIVMIN